MENSEKILFGGGEAKVERVALEMLKPGIH